MRFNATIMTVASVLNHRHNTVQVANPRTITSGVNGLEVRAEPVDEFAWRVHVMKKLERVAVELHSPLHPVTDGGDLPSSSPAPRLLYSGWRSVPYPQYRKLDWQKRVSGRCGEENTVKPRFTNASDHEQFGLRTNFPNTKRLGWCTVSRVTNTQAVNIVER